MNRDKQKDIELVIVEDEIHNSRLLQGLMNELRPNWNIKATLESVEEVTEWFQCHTAPDLILMDIQLSDGMCFSIFDKIDLPTSCRIIFTTAYNNYAIRAFKVNSIDYLLKPIDKGELEKSLLKLEELIEQDNPIENIDYDQLLDSITHGKKEYRMRFLVSKGDSYQKIQTKDIAYIYSENKLSFAVDFQGETHTLDYSLERIETELDPVDFCRANRKIIIHIDAVVNLLNDLGGKLEIEIQPKPDFEVTVSRLRATDFKQWMGK